MAKRKMELMYARSKKTAAQNRLHLAAARLIGTLENCDEAPDEEAELESCALDYANWAREVVRQERQDELAKHGEG